MARKIDAGAQTIVATPNSNGAAKSNILGTMKPGGAKQKAGGEIKGQCHCETKADCATKYLREINRNLHAALQRVVYDPHMKAAVKLDMRNGWTALIEFVPDEEALRRQREDE